MEISDVRVRPYNKADDKLKAFATITFNDCFVVSDLKVIEGNNGLFVAMPSRKRKDGKFRDVAHPLNSETRQMIEDEVLALYRQEIERMEKEGLTPSSADDFDDEDSGGESSYSASMDEFAPIQPPQPKYDASHGSESDDIENELI
ncbi:septation regulator SpoVG [Candidatus Sumerlaeota bacterium]|nr:septation regulator SpoVG [Candidatus Sumerlaeota bacterium]